ncbi:MAG: LysM peptidoglycan-binding domain-containing protein [Acidobacteriota bacterium]
MLAPAVAGAQPYMGGPSPGAPDAPRTLDPGAEAKPYTPPPPQPAEREKPNVMIVGPDGKVTYSPDQGQEPSGYYVDNGAPAPSGGNEPVEVHTGPVPELHVVRRGDTLWDICFYYFNDPWQWPKIWSYNPQITNPHWIYPGDLVRLLPRGVFAQQEPEQEGPGGNAGQPGQTDVVPPPARSTQVGIKQTAFVEKDDLDRSITVDGAVDEKTLLGAGDQVYLSYPPNRPPQVGQRYSIYTPDNVVKDNGKDVGAYVHLLGTLEVQSVRQDKRARGVIVESTQEIERGAKVGPLLKAYKTVPPVPPKVDAQGNIVAVLKQTQLIGQGELVFIDLGQQSGIEVGNRMFVVRRGDAYPKQSHNTVGQDDRRFPARALGEIVIVEVGKNISVGLVTLAVQEMGAGDMVMMQKSQ